MMAVGILLEPWGNYIGTDVNGLNKLPNGNDGIFVIFKCDGNNIGGPWPMGLGANLICGNGGAGVEVDSSNNLIQGNWIGVLNNGMNTVLANDGDWLVNNIGTNTVLYNIHN
jgi:hypothetical protein